MDNGEAKKFPLQGQHIISIETVLFWGLFGQKKKRKKRKKHINKMTWQLTAKTNWRSDLAFANGTKRWGVKSKFRNVGM